MGRYASIKEWCESIGIYSQKDVNRLGKAILAFWPLHSHIGGTNDSIRPVAQAFIDQEGSKYFSTRDGVRRETEECVAGIIKVQRRYRIDNQPRLDQLRLTKRRRPPLVTTSDVSTGSEDGSLTRDTIEVCEDSSDARNAHSRASTEDPPWLPSDSPTLIDKRKGKKKATNHQRGSGTQQTKRIRHLATRTRKVARIESTSDVFGHDRAEHGYANMVIQLSKTPPPHQPAQEHNSVPSVIEKASLVFGGHLLEFRSLSQKTQALEVVIREIDEGHRQHNDFLAEGDKLKSCVYSDAYDDTVLVPICDSLQENCIRRLSVPQENRLCPETATSDTFVVYAGVRWEFKSLLDKAEACGAALNKVLQAIDKQKDQIQQVKMQLIDKTERPRLREKRDVTRYLEFDFLARIRLWLQDNGAEFVQ